VGAALGAGDRVNLVHDHRLNARQGLARRGGEQQEQRLGGRDQDVGRLAGERPTLLGGGVPRANGDPDVGCALPPPDGRMADAHQRRAQVALDVHRQRFERGHVEDAAATLPGLRGRCRGEPVERPEKGRQRLARTGRRDDEGMPPGTDRFPRPRLRRRGRDEVAPEPIPGGRGEAVEDVVVHRRPLCHGALTVPRGAGRRTRGARLSRRCGAV